MGNSLHDLLSGTQKEKLAGITVKVGGVYRMPLTPNEGITPKKTGDSSRNKFFIVVGKDCDNNIYGIVIINSHVNNKLVQSVKDLHYPLFTGSYNFLDHNSFADCSRIKRISCTRFSDLLTPATFKGDIMQNDLDLIIGALKTAKTINKKELRSFGLIP